MTKAEEKVINIITKYRGIMFFLIISVLGTWIRFQGRTLISGDMSFYLLPWYDQMTEQGFFTLKNQVGEYNILYQELMALMTYIPWKPMYMIKVLSIAFDYLLAFAVADFACKIKREKRDSAIFQAVYAIVLLLPPVVLNSAYWGQCDSIFSFFAVLSLINLYEEKYNRSFIYLGIAFAFKLQTIFIFPFYVCLYFYKKKFSISKFLLAIFVFWLTGLPVYLLGRNLLDAFGIYLWQTDQHRAMHFHIPSVWMFVGGDCDRLESYAVAMTMMILGIGLYLVMSGKKNLDSREDFFGFACWIHWTCTLYLPNMHERYNYLLDIMWIMLVAVNKKYLPYAAASILMSTVSYGFYLYDNGDITPFFSGMMLALWCLFTYRELMNGKTGNKMCEAEKMQE